MVLFRHSQWMGGVLWSNFSTKGQIEKKTTSRGPVVISTPKWKKPKRQEGIVCPMPQTVSYSRNGLVPSLKYFWYFGKRKFNVLQPKELKKNARIWLFKVIVVVCYCCLSWIPLFIIKIKRFWGLRPCKQYRRKYMVANDWLLLLIPILTEGMNQ